MGRSSFPTPSLTVHSINLAVFVLHATCAHTDKGNRVHWQPHSAIASVQKWHFLKKGTMQNVSFFAVNFRMKIIRESDVENCRAQIMTLSSENSTKMMRWALLWKNVLSRQINALKHLILRSYFFLCHGNSLATTHTWCDVFLLQIRDISSSNIKTMCKIPKASSL